MQQELSTHVDQWGYLETHQQYQQSLAKTDLFVSTALHEFFGISVVEAIAAGAYPLVPRALAYPDVLQLEQYPEREQYFYDGSSDQLAARLKDLATCPPGNDSCSELLRTSVARFDWSVRGPQMDEQLAHLVTPV